MSDTPAARPLGFWMATALVVGNIVGAGVFLLPASLAPFGGNAWIGWGLVLAGSLCLALVLAGLSRRIAGGPYFYVSRAFGQEAGFLVMWSYWISVWTANAALAIAAVSYGSSLWPALGEGMAAPMTAIALLGLFTLINMRGAGTAGRVQVAATSLKLIPLVAVALVAAWLLGSGSPAATPTSVPLSISGVAGAAALAMFAMLGFESATLPADKIGDPEQVVPLATLTGTLVAGLATLAACAAVLFLLPGEQAATSPAPIADAISPVLGSGAGTIVAIFAVISALGAMNGWVLCSGEVPLAMSRAGVFPRWFGETGAAGTPVRAQLVSSLIAALLIAANYSRGLSGLFTFMILLSTVSNLVLYGGAAAAALKLRTSGLVALLGLLFSLFAFWGAGLEASLWGLALLLTGLPVYLVSRRSRLAEERPAEPRAPDA